MSDDTCVICPNCVHEFPAIPVNVQERIAELEQVVGIKQDTIEILKAENDQWAEKWMAERAENERLREELQTEINYHAGRDTHYRAERMKAALLEGD